ncbi:unnamed protein product [Discosporangium mesarthrocarpum]
MATTNDQHPDFGGEKCVRGVNNGEDSTTAEEAEGLTVISRPWGSVDGVQVDRIDLRSPNDFSASFCTYGATLLSLKAGDRDGNVEEVNLQHPTLESMLEDGNYYGATVGRVCNRIAGGKFSFAVEGEDFSLATNNGPNCLHGGLRGFDKAIWDHEVILPRKIVRREERRVRAGTGGEGEEEEEEEEEVGVVFRRVSPDGEEGFPGTVTVEVTYSIIGPHGHRRAPAQSQGPPQGQIQKTQSHWQAPRGQGELRTTMEARVSGRATPINLTNHAYWNLSGDFRRSIRGMTLSLPSCGRWLPLGADQVPTGEVSSVEGTPFDLRGGRNLGEAIDDVAAATAPPSALATSCLAESSAGDAGGDRGGGAGRVEGPYGLDHCLVMEGDVKGVSDPLPSWSALPLMARLVDPESGRVMEVAGSQPGLQVYSANFLSPDPSDTPHTRHNALCLETQHFPNAVNRKEWWQGVVLRPGQRYRHRARHIFQTEA